MKWTSFAEGPISRERDARCTPRRQPWWLTLIGPLFVNFIAPLPAQLTQSAVSGIVTNKRGQLVGGASIALIGVSGLEFKAQSNTLGEFYLVVPSGLYTLIGESARHDEIQIAPFVLKPREHRVIRLAFPQQAHTAEAESIKLAVRHEFHFDPEFTDKLPSSYSVGERLQQLEPTTVIEPLAFGGLSSHRLAWLSQDASTWTGTGYRLQGIAADDPYQPGRPLLLPDLNVLDQVMLLSSPLPASTDAYHTTVDLFPSPPSAAWHGEFSTLFTGSALAANNLTPRALQSGLRRSDRFEWYTRDHFKIGGALNRRIHVLFSATGQWAAQTLPTSPANDDLTSRLLFGTALGTFQPNSSNRLDAFLSRSRLDRSGMSVPAAAELLISRRMAPPLTLSPVLAEEDHLDHLQVGWSRSATSGKRGPAAEVRYGYSKAQLGTVPRGTIGDPSATISHIELLDGAHTGPPPLQNLALRTRHSLEAVLQSFPYRAGRIGHQSTLGFSWQKADSRNRLIVPGDAHAILANTSPAFVAEFNTPLDSRSRLHRFMLDARHRTILSGRFLFEVGAQFDASRGTLPLQSSHRSEIGREQESPTGLNRIDWHSLSPRVGFAVSLPDWNDLILRGSFSRTHAPLAGRYVDFGNANSLSGLEFRWEDTNADGIYQPGERGIPLRRFGGLYTTIAEGLRRPFRDLIVVSAETELHSSVLASLRLFRSDDKRRLYAMNTGVPESAYRPMTVHDPGGDAITGTTDDQILPIYEQLPESFGRDAFALTDSRWRTQNSGLVAQITFRQERFLTRASFVAEKSVGPTNPGNGVWENDPGVIGALGMDPNTLINATGRAFFDRAFVGKLQAWVRLPGWLGGVELGTGFQYFDGLVFGRKLLVPDLAQGPTVIFATARGSPEGGHRTEYNATLDLRLARTLRLGHGSVRLIADIFNVANSAKQTREIDRTGPDFNLRLPLALQPPRFLRLGIEFEF